MRTNAGQCRNGASVESRKGTSFKAEQGRFKGVNVAKVYEDPTVIGLCNRVGIAVGKAKCTFKETLMKDPEAFRSTDP